MLTVVVVYKLAYARSFSSGTERFCMLGMYSSSKAGTLSIRLGFDIGHVCMDFTIIGN